MNQRMKWEIEILWEKACANLSKNSKESTQNWTTLSPQENSFFTPAISLDELSLSKEIVFTDDYGEYSGLAQDVVFYKETKPYYIFDNHNKALMAFLEIKNQTSSPLNIVHIDAHPDDAIFSHETKEITDKNILGIYDKSRISDFLDCAQKGNLIKSLKRITTEADFLETPLIPNEPFVLSLDIDIFGPEGAFTSLESKIAIIAHYWKYASAVTIATSPGFIDQENALVLVKVFMQNLQKN